MSDVTAIYYTSNRETTNLESNVRAALNDQCQRHGVPLVSVSQKPLSGFGKNVCVGDVGQSGHNGFRQMQIAARESKTRFVCTAESDFVYPDEYFTFHPERDDTLYMLVPVWILYARSHSPNAFYRKCHGSEGAMFASRRLIIERVDQILSGHLWSESDTAKKNQFPSKVRKEYVDIGVPIVTFKTDNQLHRKSGIDVDSKTKFLKSIGSAAELTKRWVFGSSDFS